MTPAKSKTVTGLLALFLGGLGAHRFYLGQWWGVFYVLLCCTLVPTIAGIVEAVIIFRMSDEKWLEKHGAKAQAAGVFQKTISPPPITSQPTQPTQTATSAPSISKPSFSKPCGKCGNKLTMYEQVEKTGLCTACTLADKGLLPNG